MQLVFVFRDVNDGVYRCGFAGTQQAYETADARLLAGSTSCRSGSLTYPLAA